MRRPFDYSRLYTNEVHKMTAELDGPVSVLCRTEIAPDVNEHGEPVFCVHAFYRHFSGSVICVPDEKGWPTEAEAVAEMHKLWKEWNQ